MAEKYKIEVSDECVEIMGTLTIREAFDFLNFFEREGYTTLEDWGDGTTLYLRKRDIEKEKSALINQQSLEEIESLTKQNLEEKIKTIKLSQKIDDLEILIKGLMVDESDKVKQLNKKIEDLEKYQALIKLKYSKEAAEICKMEGPDAEDHSPFAGSLE